MSRPRATVDLTLDSDDEVRSKARSRRSRSTHDEASSPKNDGKSSQGRQKEGPITIDSLDARHGGSKHRTSLNTRETAFDLTADDDRTPKPPSISSNRCKRVDSKTRRNTAGRSKKDGTPTQKDAYNLALLSQSESSTPVSSKRRKTPSTRASPVAKDSMHSVAFRPFPLISSNSPKQSARSQLAHDADTGTASQPVSPRSVMEPSMPTRINSSSKKYKRRSNKVQQGLVADSSQRVQPETTPAIKATSKSASPAPLMTSDASKSTSSIAKALDRSSLGTQNQKPAQSTQIVETENSEDFKDTIASSIEEMNMDPQVSFGVQDDIAPERLRNLPQPVPPPGSNDGVRGLDSQAGATRKKQPVGRNPLPRRHQTTGVPFASQAPQNPSAFTDVQAVPITAGENCKMSIDVMMAAEATLRSNIEGDRAAGHATNVETPTSKSAMEHRMRRHLEELREDHDYLMKSWLGRSRRACDRRATALILPHSTSSLDKTAASMTVPAKFVQYGSPFAEMKPLTLSSVVKDSTKQISTLQQQIIRPAKPERPFIHAPVSMYISGPVSVPPYLTYISIRRNILAENDRSLKYYPYFGEDGPGRKSGLEKELEERFNNRIKHLPLRHWYAEQADKLAPYAARYLEDVACPMHDVLYFLLDNNHLNEPGEGSSETIRKWHARCFATDSDRQNKKWQKLFRSLQSPGPQALTRAELACKAFYDVTKLSLWYIVRNCEVTLGLLTRLQKERDAPCAAQGLHTYTDLGCLMCHVHDCPCHGEYEEPTGDKDTEGKILTSKDDSHPEDADSDSDNGMTHNVRKRVVAKPLLLRDHRNKQGHIAYDDKDVESVQDFLGLNADGTVSGAWNRTADRGNPGFTDTELCSEQCFWKKANRSGETSDWSNDQVELLESLLPAYIGSRRGPCVMTFAFDKPCYEVFNKMRSLSLPDDVKDDMPTKLAHGNSRPAPRRGWQYWYKNSVTHIHEERDPFRPCSHEGSCQDAGCSCYEANITCEKSCQCSPGCERRFRGCNCAQGNRVCWMSDHCGCYNLNRECDPDLCGTCGARDVLDPINRHDEKAAHGKCSNVYMQRAVPKRTLMGHSDIQGWGLYAGENVKANEFLGEYKGEIVSKTEGDRRGAVYHYRGIEYLFGLNKTQEIDSTRAGNKMRFINNSKKHINCYPKKVFCNTVQRIGMYAKRDIKSGEELYFDYGYPESVTKNFWDKGEPKIPAGAGPIKAGKTAIKQGQLPAKEMKTKKGRPPKHGGARTGAGRKVRAVKTSAEPSGKRADKEKLPLESGVDEHRSITVTAHEGVEETNVVESGADDDAASEVDPAALEDSESEDDSYQSAEGEEEEEQEQKQDNPQKRGWITRKENLKRKRGY